MAAPLTARLLPSIERLFAPSSSAITNGTLFQQSRNKSKSKGGQVMKNRGGGRTKVKVRGPWVGDGEFVHKGDIIAKQAGLKMYPGENVEIQKNNTLFATCDGIAMATREELNPYPDSPLYGRVQQGLKIYKKFWHVYPTPTHAKFKLVSQV